MAPKKDYTPEQMGKAIEAVARGMNISAAAQKYGVPRITLRNKITGKSPVACKMGPNTILTKEEETILKEWLLQLSGCHSPIVKDHLLDSVQRIMIDQKRENPFKNNRPGKKWYQSFLKRHPDISERVAQNSHSDAAKEKTANVQRRNKGEIRASDSQQSEFQTISSAITQREGAIQTINKINNCKMNAECVDTKFAIDVNHEPTGDSQHNIKKEAIDISDLQIKTEPLDLSEKCFLDFKTEPISSIKIEPNDDLESSTNVNPEIMNVPECSLNIKREPDENFEPDELKNSFQISVEPIRALAVSTEVKNEFVDIPKPYIHDTHLVPTKVQNHFLETPNNIKIEIEIDTRPIQEVPPKNKSVNKKKISTVYKSTSVNPKESGKLLNTRIQTAARKGPYSCDICNKSFTLKNYVRRHVLTHYVDKRIHRCEICKTGFTQKDYLKRHLLIHAGEKQFSCDVCNKSYMQREHLRRHKLVHSGTKKFICDICKKGFLDLRSLKYHQITHTDEKPHMCTICNKSFNRTSSLKRHMQIHNKKLFYCNVCNQSATQKTHLAKHILRHKGEKSNTCEICNRRFIRAASLFKHKATCHPQCK